MRMRGSIKTTSVRHISLTCAAWMVMEPSGAPSMSSSRLRSWMGSTPSYTRSARGHTCGRAANSWGNKGS